MANQYYYARTIRTVLVALINVFNDIHVYNYENPISGTTNDAVDIPVPVVFGVQDKAFLSRLEEETGVRYYLQLPKIGIAIKDIQYDPDRATGSNEYREFYDDNVALHDVESFFKDVQPTPYNVTFDMKIRTVGTDQVLQILEQILPYFNPCLHLRIKEFSFLNIERNVPVTIDSVNLEYVEPLTENDRREVNASLSITAKCQIYKPYTTSSIIKFINSRYYINTFDLSGSNSNHNLLVETYRTSGVEGNNTSAFPQSSQYDTSAYNPIKDVYIFTSGVSNF